MTGPDIHSHEFASTTQDASLTTPFQPSGITALAGNRAALTLLVMQNVMSGLLISRNVPLGLSLLGSFVATALVGLIFFRGTLIALTQDVRWKTPPSWGITSAVFVLAFIASRACALAYVTFFPQAAGTIPEFKSQGLDLGVLMLTAGLLIPFAQEVAFRGLMMRGHERAAGFTIAAITSTVAFSIAHGVPASIAGILPLAYALARLVQHTGSLWNSVIVHAANNTLAVGLGSLISSSQMNESQGMATEMLKNGDMRLFISIGALLFGLVVLFVIHILLPPKPDSQENSKRGPWLSGSYIVIIGIGLLLIAMTIPGVSQNLLDFSHKLRG